ncbi:DNA gyrase inhibitor YacG [Psittacicella gerlachiana]|uniref:DNA gyrase inhibitor YacG n=1 Tax=Psittacicella gerlachiana TaxID=2028574 RepID=A0A3A1YBK4_9GAMM|nr:DNA gyrase inhibitor YacG [Psittacicella gerlachiana]RIY34589.1 hypothetical protein CKF59_05325 [Psittacicella gerlachiana]
MTNDLKVKCPNCKKEIIYSSANPFRPFCSERCRLQDLGAWATGEYSLEAQPENEAEVEQLLELLIERNRES